MDFSSRELVLMRFDRLHSIADEGSYIISDYIRF